MEKVAYFIHSGDLTFINKECFRSIQKKADCRIILYHDSISNKPNNIELIPIDLNRWTNRRMTHRMELALELPISYGDKVLVLDTDLLFQGDPFKVFQEADFDLFYTSRAFKSNYNVNGGVWGFVNNACSRELLKFMVDQAKNPSWGPYENFRNRFRKNDLREEDWWTNQDLLCVLSEYHPPIDVSLYDAGEKYNCCPKSGGGISLTEELKKEFLSKIGNEYYIIIHYKEMKKDVNSCYNHFCSRMVF
jgi:hypothetical protein